MKVQFKILQAVMNWNPQLFVITEIEQYSVRSGQNNFRIFNTIFRFVKRGQFFFFFRCIKIFFYLAFGKS